MSFQFCTTSLPVEVKTAFEELPEVIDYNVHVQPILSDRCYPCHGPDEKSRKANLRLDLEEQAFLELDSGNRAFVKGNLNKSTSIHRIISQNPEYQMPPPESELSLTPREIAIIAKWVKQGAQWKPHWAFIPIEKPNIPEIKEDNIIRNEIDPFIIAQLKQVGLKQNPETEKERLLRRVYLDLTGVPPTIEEIDSYLADNSEDAYEKVVDRLLTSPNHAERLAMEWLDVARYADSHGVSFDGYRNSWPYRDWVINAFARNLPYNEFIIQQVAGDLIDNADHQTKLATAFYRLNPLESSQGSIDEEFRVEYVAERTATTGTAFLGLTMECARCHDHKFDPLSQKEYYQLSAFFNTTEELGLGPVDKERAPTLLLLNEKEERIIDSLEKEIYDQETVLEQREKDLRSLETYIKSLDKIPTGKDELASFQFDRIEKYKKEKKSRKKKKKKEFEEIQILDKNKKAEATLGVTLMEGKNGKAVYFDDEYDFVSLTEIGRFDHQDPFSVCVWILPKDTLRGETTQTIIGNSDAYIGNYRGWDFSLDTANHLVVRLIHRIPDDFLEIKSKERIPYDKWSQVAFTYNGNRKADGLSLFISGKEVETDIHSDKLSRSIASINSYKFTPDTIPLRIGKSYRLWTYDNGNFKGAIDDIKIFNRELSPLEVLKIGNYPEVAITSEMMQRHSILKNPEIIKIKERLKDLRKNRTKTLDTIPEIMVMEEMENPRKTFLLNKGLYNQKGIEVGVGTPQSILTFSDTLPKNRLGLAYWLTSRDNPLVARVAVNRYWQMIFGAGLVSTPEDFGIQGERPTHPQLLDWLANDFIEHNWDLRHLLKKMVMSHTYRQSSKSNSVQVKIDPTNKYYSKSNAYRWPAEIIRDNILYACGLLYDKKGGPSVKPYQPDSLWEELGGASYVLSHYKQDSSLNAYRRTLYTFVRRFSPHPFMTTFDATSREICEIRRDITNSPMQALLLMNDPQMVEASRSLSERILLEACTDLPSQIEYGFRLLTGVKPTSEQTELLENIYQKSYKYFKDNPGSVDSFITIGLKPPENFLDKNQTAALTMVANSIVNFDETYMKR